MTLPRVILFGATLGITFSLGAMLADIYLTRHLPHADVFQDPSQFLASLRKAG